MTPDEREDLRIYAQDSYGMIGPDCPYWARHQNLPGHNPEATCGFGCIDEPSCVTDPWPVERTEDQEMWGLVLQLFDEKDWFDEWIERVNEWVSRAFPTETMEQLGLSLGEEGAELGDALMLGHAITSKTGLIMRSILKESHGDGDRRGEHPWKAERAAELGDLMVVVACIMHRDQFPARDILEARLNAVIERFDAHLAEKAVTCTPADPFEAHDWVYEDDEYGSLADGGSCERYRCSRCGKISRSQLPD